MVIEEYEKKGFRIGIRPQKMYGKWYWVSGVNVGDSERANWVDKNNNLPMACYLTYAEALDEAIKFCDNYKKPIEKESTKRPRRSKT